MTHDYNWIDHLGRCTIAIAVNNPGERSPTVINYYEDSTAAWADFDKMRGDGRPKSLCNMGMTVAEEYGGAKTQR